MNGPRKLFVLKVATVEVLDTYGDFMESYSDCRIVVTYLEHGVVATIHRIPPPGPPDEWPKKDDN